MVMLSERPGQAAAPRLAELHLFSGTDRDLVAAVAERSVEIEVPQGRELLTANTEAQEFFVILDGHASVSIAGVPISYLGAGSCFGEMSLIDGRPRTANLVARSPMRLIVIGGEDFLTLLEQSPAFCRRMLTLVVGRLRLANAKLAELSEDESRPLHTEARSSRSVMQHTAPSPTSRPGREVAGMSDREEQARQWLADSLCWERALSRLRREVADEVVAPEPERLPDRIEAQAAERAADRGREEVPERVDRIA